MRTIALFLAAVLVLTVTCHRIDSVEIADAAIVPMTNEFDSLNERPHAPTSSFVRTNGTRNNTTRPYPTPVPSPTHANDPLPPRGDMTQCPQECSGYGLACVPQPSGGAKCLCRAGFSGNACELWVGCSDRNFCSGHGSCSCTQRTCQCVCDMGWGSKDCSEALPSHCPDHCSGHGQCLPLGSQGGYACTCDAGFTGVNCGEAIKGMCTHECSGQGSCGFAPDAKTDSDIKPGTCACVGTSGASCATAVDKCNGCIHGSCDGTTCSCYEAFGGQRCDDYRSETDPCLNKNFCSGRGVCAENTVGEVVCVCQEGFGGPNCDQLLASVSSMCPDYCNGHGSCDEVAKACVCSEGYSGPSCAIAPCAEASGGVMCSNHGICQPNASSFACVCDLCFSGAQCEINEVERCQGLCGGNGECLCKSSGALTEAVCSCHDGWEGPMCDIRSVTADPAECCPLDCSGNGECVSCSCQCFSGFSGGDCATSTTLPTNLSSAPNGEDALDDLSQLLQLSEGVDQEASSAKFISSEKYSMKHLWD